MTYHIHRIKPDGALGWVNHAAYGKSPEEALTSEASNLQTAHLYPLNETYIVSPARSRNSQENLLDGAKVLRLEKVTEPVLKAVPA